MRRAALLAVLVAVLPPAHGAGVPAAAAPCTGDAVPKIAFVFEGAPRDLPAHRAAMHRVAQRLGASACVRTFDHLSTGVDPDANARFLLGSLGLERYALVFLLTSRHAASMGKVVPQFPGTTYLQLGGLAHSANLVPYGPSPRRAGWSGWEDFYGAAVQCMLAGKRLKGARARDLCA
jgi:hypothetical protein